MQLTGTPDLSSLVKDAVRHVERAADLPQTLVLAVSGGSDSMALLRIAQGLARREDRRVLALTVDHGLRPDSASEAAQVAAWCADLGVEHRTLHWHHDGSGNLSAAAREGRYRLMAEFCLERGYEKLYTGHTADDQAETVLLRLARGSGVDGLSGMAVETPLWGIAIVRPFVHEMRRTELREILREVGQDWIDDPTNDDDSYERVKARHALAVLEPLGITAKRLTTTAYMQTLARDVLEQRADDLRAAAVRAQPAGYLTVMRAPVEAAPEETALRVIAGLLRQVSGQFQRPRLTATRGARFMICDPNSEARTLHGCLMRPAGEAVHILREPAACVAAMQPRAEAVIWDGRFRVSWVPGHGPADGVEVRALNEAGIGQIPKDYNDFPEAWRMAPRAALLTTPGLWRGDILLAAPLAGWNRDPHGPQIAVHPVWPASCSHASYEVD